MNWQLGMPIVRSDTESLIETIYAKLPTNNIMGSSVKTDKDDEIDAILADTNELQVDDVPGLIAALVVPDVAGTAATLHGITDGKVDAMQANITDVLVDTDELQADDIPTLIAAAYHGLDSKIDNLVVPDAAGVAAILHEITDAKIDEIAVSLTAETLVAALLAATGVTAGGTWTVAKVMKVLAAWSTGNWRDKAGVPGTYQILDPDDGATVIAEITPSQTSPQKTVSVKI